MIPLSIFTYYINNKRRFFAAFLAVFISVFLLYVIQILVDSSFYTTERTYVEPQKYYSSITPKGTLLDPEVVESVRGWDSVEKVIPWAFQYINFYCMVGGDTGSKVFTVWEQDMAEVMELLHMKLIQGRLPNPDSQEIAVHHLLAKNKGLTIGDMIGSHVEKEEALKGEYEIVGLLEGKSIVSFAGLEKWTKKNEVYDPYRFGVIIIPKENQLQELNRRLEYLPLTDLDLRTLELVKSKNYQSLKGLFVILNLINLAVVFIVSICVGFLTYIFMYQRRGEFALLIAMGYTRREVLSRSCREIIVLCLMGYFSGIVMAILSGAIAQGVLFYPNGEIIRLLDFDFIVKTSCVPLFATLFSTIPIYQLLGSLDPVSILEGGMTDAD